MKVKQKHKNTQRRIEKHLSCLAFFAILFANNKRPPSPAKHTNNKRWTESQEDDKNSCNSSSSLSNSLAGRFYWLYKKPLDENQ